MVIVLIELEADPYLETSPGFREHGNLAGNPVFLNHLVGSCIEAQGMRI